MKTTKAALTDFGQEFFHGIVANLELRETREIADSSGQRRQLVSLQFQYPQLRWSRRDEVNNARVRSRFFNWRLTSRHAAAFIRALVQNHPFRLKLFI